MQLIRDKQNSNNIQSNNEAYLPSSQTVARLKDLGYVGTALNEVFSETTFSTNLFVAKESLNRFEQSIKQMQIDQTVKKGMEDLIAYLHNKIDRRLKNVDSERQEPIS